MNSLTNDGELACLSTPGFAAKVAHLRLFTTASTPSEAGTGFVEASGGSYAAIAISSADFTFSVVAGNGRVTMGTKSWTATGGNINSIGGVYITDSGGDVLAWWESVTPGTLINGASQSWSGLFVGGPFGS